MNYEKKLLNIKTAAEQLGVTVNTLYSWVCHRKIRFIKAGRLVRFKQQDLDSWVTERTVETVNDTMERIKNN